MAPQEREQCLEEMSSEERALVLSQMSLRAAEIAHMSSDEIAACMMLKSEEETHSQLAYYLAMMSSEERAACLSQMSPAEATACLEQMLPEARAVCMEEIANR
jgi:flagellar motility protein MotE (MotC chaperone)